MRCTNVWRHGQANMPDEIYISDTSSLIALERIEGWFLFEILFARVVVVREVVDEFNAKFRNRLPEWIEVRELSYNDVLEKPTMKLDSGEAASIALALETPRSTIIIDEEQGRKEAARRGLKVVGMLGVLQLAKNAGVIDLITPCIERLKNAGFRMSETLVQKILQQSGELE